MHMFKELDFKPGNVVFDDFPIDPKIPLHDQMEVLKEDLFQVNYFGTYIIDVGWYPEFKETGSFKLTLIKDYNWNEPLMEKRSKDLDELRQYMGECIALVKELVERDSK